MARPNKIGLDYFPLDTDIDQDDKRLSELVNKVLIRDNELTERSEISGRSQTVWCEINYKG